MFETIIGVCATVQQKHVLQKAKRIDSYSIGEGYQKKIAQN